MSQFTFRCENHPFVAEDTHPASPVQRFYGEPGRTVMSGASYRISHDTENQRKIVTVMRNAALVESGQDDHIVLYVGPKEPLAVIYVMNEAGRTIDTIR